MLAVVSPGVPPDLQLVRAAVARGAVVATELEFAWHHRRDASLAAVTGSNGKSTTAHLLSHIFSAAGMPSACFGTLGYFLPDGNVMAAEIVRYDRW